MPWCAARYMRVLALLGRRCGRCWRRCRGWRRGRRAGRRPWRRPFGHPVAGHESPRPVGEVLPVRRCPSVARAKGDPAPLDPDPLPALQGPEAGLPCVSGTGLRYVNHPRWRGRTGQAHDRSGEDGRVSGEEEEPRDCPPVASGGQDRREDQEKPRDYPEGLRHRGHLDCKAHAASTFRGPFHAGAEDRAQRKPTLVVRLVGSAGERSVSRTNR